MFALGQAVKGKCYRVQSVNVPQVEVCAELAAMGLLSVAQLRVIGPAPFGDPIEYLVNSRQLMTLNQSVAMQIEVVEETRHE